MSIKSSNDSTGNWSRDLACSVMPQPTAPPCAPSSWIKAITFLSCVAFVIWIDLYHKHLVTYAKKSIIWYLQCTCCLHCSSIHTGTYNALLHKWNTIINSPNIPQKLQKWVSICVKTEYAVFPWAQITFVIYHDRRVSCLTLIRVAPCQLSWLALWHLISIVRNMKQFGILRLMP
jgi:hypothetical protein